MADDIDYEWDGASGLYNEEAVQSDAAPTTGSFHPITFLQEMHTQLARSCRVLVNQNPAGTGFLVGPDLVMTCLHVIEQPAGADYLEHPPQNLSVSFQEIDGWRTIVGSKNYDVVDVIARAPASQWERAMARLQPGQRAPAFVEPERGELDYAVLKIDTRVGDLRAGILMKRGWFALRTTFSNAPAGMGLSVVHQPQGRVLLSIETQPRLDRTREAMRVGYLNPTQPGSSGALMATLRSTPIALHQFGMARGDGLNRGVPIEKIRSHIDAAWPDCASAMDEERSPARVWVDLPSPTAIDRRGSYIYKSAHDRLHNVYATFQSSYLPDVVNYGRGRSSDRAAKDAFHSALDSTSLECDEIDRLAASIGYADGSLLDSRIPAIRRKIETARAEGFGLATNWSNSLIELCHIVAQAMEGLDAGINRGLPTAKPVPSAQTIALCHEHSRWAGVMKEMDAAQAQWLKGAPAQSFLRRLERIIRRGQAQGATVRTWPPSAAAELGELLPTIVLQTAKETTLPFEAADAFQSVMDEMSDVYKSLDEDLKRALSP